MAINRQKKEELVALYTEHIEKSSALVFTDYRGAKVGKINSLRSRLRTTGTEYVVTKKTLLNLALEQSGRKLDLSNVMDGSTAVAFLGEDIGTSVKALKDWIKSEADVVRITGAVLDTDVLDVAQAEALADLPTREQMLAKLLATIIAPASQLVRTINEPGASLARVLKAQADKEAA
ncbi:MAG: 50S ribosomal protein L10 [Caldilineaceae bacterium]|nr:50S ribosomal protein L10 [Caldilineaceae bacterium]HRJ41859.1 50S ribosomal protein L10 [Caldilineaceae bacterium]